MTWRWSNAASLRARVRELEIENGLIQRELAHVGEVAERQGQQLQCAAVPSYPFTVAETLVEGR